MAYMITELDPLAAICKTVLVPVIGFVTGHKNITSFQRRMLTETGMG